MNNNIRKFFKRNEPPSSNPPQAVALEQAASTTVAIKTSDDVLREAAASVDEVTAARDERTVDRDQRDRAAEIGEQAVRNFYLGPLKTTGADAAILDEVLAASRAETAAATALMQATETREAAQRAVPPSVAPPTAPVIQLFFTGAALTTTLAMSLAPIEPFMGLALDAPTRAYIAATITAAIMSGAAVGAIYGLEVHEPGQTPIFAGRLSSRTAGYFASAVMVASVAGTRMTTAVTASEIFRALCIAGIEVALLSYAKTNGAQHRAEMDVWRESQAGRPAALAALEIAVAHEAARKVDAERAAARLVAAKLAEAVRRARDFDLTAALTAGAEAGTRAYERRVDLNAERARQRRQPAA